jgi:hypothetical protein
MKYLFIATCLISQILYVISCSRRRVLTINGDAICCEPNPFIIFSCCCFDHNLKRLIEINYPSGGPPVNFIDTTGLDCYECDLGVLCG